LEGMPLYACLRSRKLGGRGRGAEGEDPHKRVRGGELRDESQSTCGRRKKKISGFGRRFSSWRDARGIGTRKVAKKGLSNDQGA